MGPVAAVGSEGRIIGEDADGEGEGRTGLTIPCAGGVEATEGRRGETTACSD